MNLPHVVTFSGGNTVTYGYDGAGSKSSVTYQTSDGPVKMDYVGNKVYNNGTLSMILTEEGYVTLSGSGTPMYHYYLKDHQGNNRVVMDQAGTVLKVNHYYPFGGLFGEGLQALKHRYKYNGKELDRTMNLDLYDFHWRQYMADIGRTTTMDPHTENYYSLSSYSMFANNPVNVIDPTGMDTVYIAHDGHMDYRRGGENDIVYVTNKRGNVTSRTYGLGTLQGGGQRNLKGEGLAYAYLSVNNKENSKDIFEFLADNTSVEFGNSTFRNGDGSMSNYITTSHETGVESGFAYLSIDNELYNNALLSYDHSHPFVSGDPRRSREDQLNYPSGLPDSQFPKRGDMDLLRGKTKIAIRNLHPIPKMRIYVPGKGYRSYNVSSTLRQFKSLSHYEK